MEGARNAEAIASFTFVKTLAVVLIREVFTNGPDIRSAEVERTVRQCSASPCCGSVEKSDLLSRCPSGGAIHLFSTDPLGVETHVSFDVSFAERFTFIVSRFSATEAEREFDLTGMRIQGKGD